MAHLVTNQLNKKGDLVLKGVPAWHGLGTVITNQEMTTAEVLKYSGLDFQVEKSPNIHRIGEQDIVSEESFFTYRTDKNIIMGSSVGSKYTIVQNIDALDLMDELAKKGVIQWESASALNDGKTTFICAKVSNIELVGKDNIVQYVVFSNSHDGSSAIRAYFTNVRVVCNNTLQSSLKNAKSLHKIRHTTNAKFKIEEAFKVMGLAKANLEESSEMYAKMQKTKLEKANFWNFLGNVFLDEKEIQLIRKGEAHQSVISSQKKKVLDGVLEYAYNGVGQEMAGVGTSWWAYNAITGYVSNEKNYKSQESRFDNMLFGEDNKLMSRSLELALYPNEIIPLTRTYELKDYQLN